MSHPNNNDNNNFPSQFNFGLYGAQPSQSVGDISFPQWTTQGSRPGSNGSRPAQSFRPRGSASGTRPGNITSFASQSNVPPSDHRIDPSLSNNVLLAVPSLPRHRPALDANPIARFYGEDAPWSSERMRNSLPFDRNSFSQPNMDYGTYRETPASDIGSIGHKSDSGYYTTQATHSIISNELDHCDQNFAPEVPIRISNITVNSTSSDRTDPFRMGSVDQTSQYSSRSGGQGKDIKCPECNEVSKCNSDHKKHMLKHRKPFKCDVANCRRGGKGFTTVNDLNRHKKSVHSIGVFQNSYQCASETCRNKEKIWPRLDNFKQHISRMHSNEDEQNLIQRSVYRAPEPTPTAEPLAVAPMDTTLAGIGTEKQFPSNDSDDPISGISLTPDQSTNPWTNFDLPSSYEFAMDVDQTNPGSSGHCSRKIDATPRPKTQGRDAIVDTEASSRSNSLRLATLAELAVSSQASPQKPAPLPPQLSNAPQTKADQQKQALRKFSKMIVQDIQKSGSNDSVDLESVVLRLLYSATRLGRKDGSSSRRPSTQTKSSADHSTPDSSDMGNLTKTEALKASQAISNLMKQTQTKPIGVSNRPKPFSNNMKTCKHCDVALARSCDMRKHMKRHTRPYGCTYPKCNKRFGAKSDWKRHENSQHFQLESFRCCLTSSFSKTPCGELFYRAEMFKNHLQTDHKMMDTEQLTHEVRNRRIGKNGQGAFWCGFCERIVRLDKQRNAAWDERFDHIDYHFNKEKRKIENWLCVEAKKTKGEVQKEMDKNIFDDEDEDMNSPDDEPTSPQSNQPEGPGEPSQKPVPSISINTASVPDSNSNPRKRPAAAADPPVPPPPQKRIMKEISRYCCLCSDGPWAHNLAHHCMSCQHQLCKSCPVSSPFVWNGDYGG